jgi:hypothetical protein
VGDAFLLQTRNQLGDPARVVADQYETSDAEQLRRLLDDLTAAELASVLGQDLGGSIHIIQMCGDSLAEGGLCGRGTLCDRDGSQESE